MARLAYTRTTAVMSMVGYLLGLGDRHGENILFDACNGDTVHVDLNCLFNKGRDLRIPEVSDFRDFGALLKINQTYLFEHLLFVTRHFLNKTVKEKRFQWSSSLVE